jgi:TonB family protein
MFNNLIESSSHAKEFKRRGSFLLFTSATYVMLFVITGVVSIYAYDAHLEERTTELELLTFVPPPAPEAVGPVPRNTIRPAANQTDAPTRSTRIELIDSASNPNNPPKDVGTVAPNVPPARSDSVIGTQNADPIVPSNRGGTPGGTGTGPVVVDMPDIPPPPPPTTNPVVPQVLKISTVLNGQAILLPKPKYPPMASQIRLQGVVTVQVLIDETGKVMSAKAVSGHPILVPEAQRAALQARFSPTMISNQPVKVSGVITYNFVLQ